MQKVSPAYFYGLGYYINSVLWLRADTPFDVRGAILHPASNALEQFLAEEEIAEALPRAVASGRDLLGELLIWKNGEDTIETLPVLHGLIAGFSFTLAEELDRTYNYRVSDKGNLSIDRLMAGASKGYDAGVLALLDSSVTEEINQAGRALAFTLFTACGFHILRSVEICIKAYLYATAGALPPINRRNWSEYIDLLGKNGASKDLTDLLVILKAKRNPLMHPQDSLMEAEAIDILCICQAVTGAIIADINARVLRENKPLDKAFTASLALLPKL